MQSVSTVDAASETRTGLEGTNSLEGTAGALFLNAGVFQVRSGELVMKQVLSMNSV